MNAKTNTFKSAVALAKRLDKEYGPVTVLRAVTQRYASLERRDVLEVARALRYNEGTASRQFQEVRGPHGVRVNVSTKSRAKAH